MEAAAVPTPQIFPFPSISDRLRISVLNASSISHNIWRRHRSLGGDFSQCASVWTYHSNDFIAHWQCFSASTGPRTVARPFAVLHKVFIIEG